MMKRKITLVLFVLAIVFNSCGPKPYYETHVGKKKQKHYNQLQYGQQD